MDKSGVESSNLLSQSYAQGLKRMARNEDQFGLFEVPPEIIEAREQTWDNLCKKYSKKLSDEIEITITSPSDEEDEEPDEDEAEEEEDIDDAYFVKSRTPMRKSKLLVQYWVDTGNAPYGLMNENYKSDTGSSLSEAESPKMGQKVEDGTSIYSSVDTAVYILSNTNVTKKAETMAIVEGARELESPREKVDLNTSNPENNANNNNNTLQVSSAYASQILTKLEERIQGKSLHKSRLRSCTSDESEEDEITKVLPTRMKITDVLPALEQLDNLMGNSAVDNLKNRPDEGSRPSSGTPPVALSKKFNRKKLYIDRNSPIDIIVSSSLDRDESKNATHFHPAFQGTPKIRQPIFRGKISKLRSSEDSQDENFPQAPEGKTTTLGLVPSPTFNTRRIPKKRQGEKLYKRMNGASDNEDDESGEASGEDSTSVDKQNDLLMLCTSKLLSVPLEHLSKSVLKRVDERKGAEDDSIPESGNPNGRKKKVTGRPASKKQIEPSKSRDSSPKSAKAASPLPKIEVDSQGSDQSTIIICKCKSDVEAPVSLRNRSTNSEVSESSRVTVMKKQMIGESDREENVNVRILRNRTVILRAPENKKNVKSRNVKTMKTDRCPVTKSPRDVKQKKPIEKNTNLTIANHLMTDCDSFSDSSVDKRERKQLNETKRRQANPIISFSSDDESDFIKVMNRSAEQYERKLRSKRELIDDLTVQPVEMLLNRIAESDEEEIIDFSNKEVRFSKRIRAQQDIKLKELHMTIPKIPEDLEKSSQSMKKLSPTLLPSTSLNLDSIKKSLSPTMRKTRSSRKRLLPSEDEYTEPDFIVKNKSPEKKSINQDSSDIDSTKCTKLFHNSFDDSDDALSFSVSTRRKNNPSITNKNNSTPNIRILRTRHNSDSND